MSEPWNSPYRQLAIVPAISGQADTGYTVRFAVNRTTPDGSPEIVVSEACTGVFPTEETARDAALLQAKQRIDALLD